ncbi:MAG: 4Fe-4S dicluster domain-containing protein [Anaerolineales bacterium]
MKVFGRTPLDILNITTPHGQVFLIPERCKGCELCVNFCPLGILQLSQETNTKGYHIPIFVTGKENSCAHCEFCTLICPEFAIFSLYLDGSPYDE